MIFFKKGFTLIEILVVVSIIGLLSSIVFNMFAGVRAKTQDSFRMQELVQIKTALELYQNIYNRYPISAGSHAGWKNDCDTGVTFVIPELITEGLFAGVKDLIPCSAGHWGFTYGSNGVNYKLVSHSESSSTGLDAFIDTAQDGGIDRCILDGTNKSHIAIWTEGAVCWLEASAFP